MKDNRTMLLSLVFFQLIRRFSLYRVYTFIFTRTRLLFEFPFAREVCARLAHSGMDMEMMLENEFPMKIRPLFIVALS